MKNRLPCEIVQDLLPSYVDGLTNSVTNETIETHIKTCEACKQSLNAMYEPEKKQMSFSEKAEIDFLKKAKKKQVNIIIGTVVTAILAVALILFIRFYLIGSRLYGESVACNVSVSGQMLTVDGVVADSGLGISAVEYEEKDGVVTIGFQATLASPFHKGEFQSEYTAQEKIEQVCIGDRIIWDHGENISANVSAVYHTKHEYIGDMPANSRTAAVLGMSGYIGNFTNELQTSVKPYGWKLILEENVEDSRQMTTEGIMKSYAYVLLAVIDNLGEVIYEYSVEDTEKILTVSQQEASEFAGKNIKECGQTAAELQKLMQQTGLSGYAVANGKTAMESIRFEVINNSDDDFYSMDITYYLDGEIVGTQSGSAADYSAIQKGETLYFDFYPEDFGEKLLQEVTEIKIEISVSDRNGKSYIVKAPIYIETEYGSVYRYVLTGNSGTGYQIDS